MYDSFYENFIWIEILRIIYIYIYEDFEEKICKYVLVVLIKNFLKYYFLYHLNHFFCKKILRVGDCKSFYKKWVWKKSWHKNNNHVY